MRLLLDTHTFLWFAVDDPQLSTKARSLLLSPDHTKAVSVATLWEIVIKLNVGKLELDMPFEQLCDEGIQGNGFQLLHAEPRYLRHLVTLPRHHGDPFDRLIIVQALNEAMTVVGRDSAMDAYGIQRVW